MAGPTLPRASEIGAPITCCGAWVIYSRLQRPQDAVYPLSKKDATGDEYDGDDHNYIIRFEKGQLPTAEAFWSLTMTIPTSSSCQTRSIATISPHCQPGRLGPAVSAGGFSRQGQEASWLPAPKREIRSGIADLLAGGNAPLDRRWQLDAADRATRAMNPAILYRTGVRYESRGNELGTNGSGKLTEGVCHMKKISGLLAILLVGALVL